MAVPSSPAGASSTSTSTESAPARGFGQSGPVALVSAAPAVGAIEFDEFGLGTTITDDYAAQGVVFTSQVFTTTDGANPTSPVLSGTPKFYGDIVGHFTVPGTTTATTVDGFSLDVGFINDRNSVEIDYFDAAGTLVGSTRAQSYGINEIAISYRGVASFKVSAVEYEEAGFAIDNLAVQRGAVGIKPLRMAQLGDSYSSGEGLVGGDGSRYDCGTDLHESMYRKDTTVPAGWVWENGRSCLTATGSMKQPKDLYRRPLVKYKNLCHRSGRAYPNQIREKLLIPPQNAIFTACSGATTLNIGALPTAGAQYVSSPFGVHGGQPQLQNVEEFTTGGGPPELITIGVGGNDARFSEIIKQCLSFFNSCIDADFRERTISTINGTMYRSVADTFSALRKAYPPATIVAFGYPSVIDDPASSCAGLVRIGVGERVWLKETVLPTINEAIKDAAAEAGVSFVDITQVTAGYGVCSSDPWINGLRFGDDNWVVGNESFHPNQRAHDAIAKLFIEHYTDGAGRLLMTNPEPSGPIRPTSGSEIRIGGIDLGAGRACGVVCLQPAACIQACAVHVSGSGFTPGVVLNATLHSDPVALGQVTVDPAGAVDATLKLPRGVPAGIHGLTLDGTSADGVRQRAGEAFHVYRRIPSRIRLRFSPAERGVRVESLTVRRARAGIRIDIACARGGREAAEALAGGKAKGRSGCPFGHRAFRPGKRKLRQIGRALTAPFKKPLAPGTVLKIAISQSGEGGRVLDARVRRGKRPKLSWRCTDPGSVVSVPCG